jgi:xanthine dehydrogenase accessory factor
MDAGFLKKVTEAVENGSAVALCTVVKNEGSAPGKPGFAMLVRRDGSIEGTVGGGEIEKLVLEDALSGDAGPRLRRFEMRGRPEAKNGTHMVCGGAAEVFIEPLGTRHTLVIFGGGHCGMALSRMAAMAGFRVVVYDERAEWANREKHPDASETICAPYSEAADRVAFGKTAYIVIMTHGHAHDEVVLRACLGKEHAYLGLIGSRAKVKRFFDALRAEGRADEELSRVFAPIGLDIGSDTPAEIAVSILAQIIAVRAGVTAVEFSQNPLARG